MMNFFQIWVSKIASLQIGDNAFGFFFKDVHLEVLFLWTLFFSIAMNT
jgi:hypothetical protein